MTRTKQTNIDRQTVIWFLLGIVVTTLVVAWISFATCIDQLEQATEGLNVVEYISTGTQRLVKQELSGSASDEIMFYLDISMEELLPNSSGVYPYFNDNPDILAGIDDVTDDWELLKSTIADLRLGESSDYVISASERHFYHSASLSHLVMEEVAALSLSASHLQIVLMLQIAMIVFIIGGQLMYILHELRSSRALSNSMMIDATTGLYNRSKCQDMLRSSDTPANLKCRAMVVFDLNDLKVTNDQWGHQVGDALIASFAKVIKDATQITDHNPFVGRYGGDEFIVYYQSVEEQTVEDYLAEVARITQQFNRTERRFQISYAAGSSIFTREKNAFTLQALFDEADKKMYANKQEIKRKRAEAGILSPR